MYIHDGVNVPFQLKPEATDSTIRLAGTIRWFGGDPDNDGPLWIMEGSST